MFHVLCFMNILWHGQSFFEIVLKGDNGGTVKIVIDPFSKEIGLRPPRTEADILLITHQHPDHNNREAIKGEPLAIASPGEYEVKGVFVKSISAFHDNSQGKERGEVVVYRIEAEGLKLCHLSDLGQRELTDEQVERIGEVDILFIPVGGNYTIDAKAASNIISQIEPRIVVPMHYKIANLKIKLDGLDKFLKQMGSEDVEKLKKLKVKPKDLPQEETKIVVLEP